jgi:hypothetical protein
MIQKYRVFDLANKLVKSRMKLKMAKEVLAASMELNLAGIMFVEQHV